MAYHKDPNQAVKTVEQDLKQVEAEKTKAGSELHTLQTNLCAIKKEHRSTKLKQKKQGLPADRSNEVHTVSATVRNPLGEGRYCVDVDLDLLKVLKSKMIFSAASTEDTLDEDAPTEDAGGSGGGSGGGSAQAGTNDLYSPTEVVEVFSSNEFCTLLADVRALLGENKDSDTAGTASSPTHSVLDNKKIVAIFGLIEALDQWDFDVFKLQESMTGSFLHEGLVHQPRGGSLFVVTYCIFHQHNLLRKFNIDEQILLNWISVIEAGYYPNPYHNSMHAADVLHVTNFVITRGGLKNSVQLSDDDMLAAVVSAAIHDYNHPGINNNFHVKAQSYLAVLFNDKSVLENVHVSSVFELMKIEQFNIFQNINEERKRNIKETVTEMVLATDMILHAKILSSFKRKVMDGAKLTKKDDVRLALSMIMKLADISNCSRPYPLYINWCNHITDEFYLQGDRELALGHQVSPFMDRYSPTVAKGQIAFMNYIVVPLFECMSEYLPDIRFTVDCCLSNQEFWKTPKE